MIYSPKIVEEYVDLNVVIDCGHQMLSFNNLPTFSNVLPVANVQWKNQQTAI